MKRFLIISLVLIVSLAAAGCNVPTATPQPPAIESSLPPSTVTPLPEPTATVSANLTL